MMHARIDFFAESLGLSTSMTILLPQWTRGQIAMDDTVRTEGFPAGPPVLYLLHGSTDDDTIWMRRTSIERYASTRGLAVVMPQVNLSNYCDEVYGLNYWTFVSEELPALVANTFHVSTVREDTFVAGLSMGGFGAFKLALNKPEQYAAAASLSGALNYAGPRWRHGDPARQHRIWGGEPLTGTMDDLVHLVGSAEPETLPSLYLSCGTEDFLLDDNTAFVTAAEQNSVNLVTDFRPGTHEWGYWDRSIQDVLGWLPIRDSQAG